MLLEGFEGQGRPRRIIETTAQNSAKLNQPMGSMYRYGKCVDAERTHRRTNSKYIP